MNMNCYASRKRRLDLKTLDTYVYIIVSQNQEQVYITRSVELEERGSLKRTRWESQRQWSGQWRNSPRGFLMLLKAGASSSDPSAEYEKTNKQELKKPKWLLEKNEPERTRDHHRPGDKSIAFENRLWRDASQYYQKKIIKKINHNRNYATNCFWCILQ